MTKRSGKLLLWSPRIFGILVCLFLSLFALDAFGGGKTFIQALPDFAIHVSPIPNGRVESFARYILQTTTARAIEAWPPQGFPLNNHSLHS
jgi:hypothetical protein